MHPSKSVKWGAKLKRHTPFDFRIRLGNAKVLYPSLTNPLNANDMGMDGHIDEESTNLARSSKLQIIWILFYKFVNYIYLL